MGAVTTFVGREIDRARVVDLVSMHRLVTLTGPAGVGKTRLSLEAGTELASRIPDGVRQVELAPLEPTADVGAAVAAQLGFPTLDAAAVGHGDAAVLVLLDNCEHVLAGAAEAAATLVDLVPNLHVLATSRSPLAVPGEHVVVLHPLPLPADDDPETVLSSPVAQLYLDRARAAGAAFEPTPELLTAVASLCRRLDGLPLAVELAAARARTLGPADVLAHVEHRLDVVRRAGEHGRHTSLRTAVETSYELLDADEQQLFRRLAVFAGHFDVDLVHDVCGGDRHRLDTIDLLARLVDRSMVVTDAAGGAVRYHLLETLRDYAAERLAEAGEADAIADAYVDRLVSEAVSIVVDGMRSWSTNVLDRIQRRFRDLVAAVDRCVAADETPHRAWTLLLPLFGVVQQSSYREVAAAGVRVVDRWPDVAGPGRAEAEAVVASACLAAGDIDRARALAEHAGTVPDALPVARLIADRTLAFLWKACGDRERSLAHFRSARDAAGVAPAFARELALSEASVLGADDLDAGVAQADAAAADANAADDPVNVARAAIVAGGLLVAAGRTAEARPRLERALVAGDEAGYRWVPGAARRLLAACDVLDHGWDASLPAWRTALDDVTAAGDLRETSLTLQVAAGAAARAGQAELAADLLRCAPDELPLTIQPDVFAGELAELRRHVRLVTERPSAAVRRARALLDGGARPVTVFATMLPSLEPRGDVWDATYAGATVAIRPRKGLADLAALVARPGVDVHALELMGGVDVGGAPGAGIDDVARRQYQARIRELQGDIDDAVAANDLARAERAELELDALVQQLSEAFGLGGRARSSGSAAERARSAVSWRIRAAIKAVGEAHPELGRHLRHSVRTGTWCSYRPDD